MRTLGSGDDAGLKVHLHMTQIAFEGAMELCPRGMSVDKEDKEALPTPLRWLAIGSGVAKPLPGCLQVLAAHWHLQLQGVLGIGISFLSIK